MTATQAPGPNGRPAATLLAALIPWVAFVVAMAIADRLLADESISYGGLAAATPVYLGFISVPSLLPLAAAPAGWMRLAVLLVMTTVAAATGVTVMASDDGQAGLAVLLVPYVAVPLAGVLWIGRAIASRPSVAAAAAPAEVSARLAALAIDVAIVGAVLVVPLTVLSHRGHEILAGAIGVTASAAYFAVGVAAWRRTAGQALVGLAVVDARTGGRASTGRAVLRSLVIVAEVAAAPTIILAPAALAELMAVLGTGRSLTDRLLGTAVVTRPR